MVVLAALAVVGMLAGVFVGVVGVKRLASAVTCEHYMQWAQASVVLVQELAPTEASGRLSIEQDCEASLFAEGAVAFVFHTDTPQATCDELAVNFTSKFGADWNTWEDRGTSRYVCAAGLGQEDSGASQGDVEYYVETNGRVEILAARYAVLGD